MTAFKNPENKTIQQMEDEVIAFWKKHKIFEKSVEQRSAKDLYVFYDGPPFISGLPHYGHLLGSIAKDVIPRYQTMKGKRVERVWGWDAHGLTVENRVQKKLGIKNRRDIESYGLEKFIQECYKYTSEVSAEWQWYVDKIGRWVDMENAYKTIDQSYMESVIWAFKQLYDKGLIYEGVRTSLFCPTCGTPVSNFEIAMDNSYKDYEDPAITVAFKVLSEGKFAGTHLLAWTTTPWTIPSNRALVIDEQAEYVIADVGGKKFIVAKVREESVFSGLDHKLTNTFLGKELLGLKYAPIYDFYVANDKDFHVYAYPGMVNMEDGTGIVHSAPGFGEIDTEMGNSTGLTLMFSIDDEGKFKTGDNGTNPFEGIYYAKANPVITQDLQQKDVLFKNEKIVHRVPYHDRCETLLIQKAQSSWFIKVSELKTQLVKNNKDINWVPEHLKEGRFKVGIEQAPDWCISRSRFWATPMPVWKSEDGDLVVAGSIAEIEKLSGQKVKDLHRPYIDELTITKNGKIYRRVPDVLDSWFEAGSMPYAQIHYPFENQQKFEKNFPGDYIVEYIAQVRAWFYVMHVLSTALFEKNSFKNVVTTGVMAGSDGRKMSKTYGNYTDPKELLEKIGGDALRLYLMGSPLMMGENANFDLEELKTKLKNVINPLWNSAKFFLMYAVEKKWAPKKQAVSENLLDRWVVARFKQTVSVFSSSLDKYTFPPAFLALESFVDDLSRWYVRRSRNRIANGDESALYTLYNVLYDFAKVAAPAMPFISETIYKSLSSDSADPVSVHLCDFPQIDTDLSAQETDLLKKMQVSRDIVTLGHGARTQASIAVRQPLSEIRVKLTDPKLTLDPDYLNIICDELNVKKVIISDDLPAGKSWLEQESKVAKISLNTDITNDLQEEGNLREFIRAIQGLRKQSNLSLGDTVVVKYPSSTQNEELVKKRGEEIKKKVFASKLVPGDKFAIE